jgi:hypothetical protein
MPITDTDLDTAYANAVSAFDTLQTELEDAATQEESIPAGGTDDEYTIASRILELSEYKQIKRLLNQMRAESSA